MRRPLAVATFAVLVLTGFGIKVVWPSIPAAAPKPIKHVIPNTTSTDGFYVATPPGLARFPEALLPLP